MKEKSGLDAISRKKKLARIAIVVAAVLAALVVVYFILASAAKRRVETDYEFFEPDWSCDIMTDPDYLAVGWAIDYTDDTGVTVRIEDDDYAKYGVGVQLLSYYFASIQAGDSETYNSLFEDEYLSVNGRHAAFTPQRIYDLKIRLVSEERLDATSKLYTYEIGYKIMKNDGTFTTEIGSDMSRPQYVTVIAGDSGVYIRSAASVYRGN